MINTDWRINHLALMKELIAYINSVSDSYILKGGTSLMLCYNLTRFSEDIDLDGFSDNFFDIIDNFISHKKGMSYRKGKDTNTVKRAFIHYGGKKPLKVEVSYRIKRQLTNDYFTIINGIRVYPIDRLMYMKLVAFTQRDKIRDLYDIVFIYNNYKQYLSSGTLIQLQDAISYKGLEQFDYLMKDQSDELVDNNYLAEQFLYMYYDLGLQ